MSLELLNTAASVGTFVVITATAISAIIQLRHLRTSNQLTGLLDVLGRSENPIFVELREDTKKVAREKLIDPAFRRALEDELYDRRDAPWVRLYNWYDYVGSLVKQGFVTEKAVLDIYSTTLASDWKEGEGIIAITRRRRGPGVWENFEYLTWRAHKWLKLHHGSAYPRAAQRLPLVDKWLDEDRRARQERMTG